MGARPGDRALPRCALAKRWRVEQPAVGIQIVQPARHVERRIRPQVAVVDLAVVAHLRDHLVAEVVVQAQHGVGAKDRAADYIGKNYAGQKIKEAAKIVDSKKVTTYEAEVKEGDLIFDANGKFLKKVVEAKDKGDEKDEKK